MFAAPIAASKSMSKLTCLQVIFRRISILGSNMGFQALTFSPCPSGDVKNRGRQISGFYQSPLILTEYFNILPNKRFLSHGMLPLSGHDDVALFE